jgi:hypothetical protein
MFENPTIQTSDQPPNPVTVLLINRGKVREFLFPLIRDKLLRKESPRSIRKWLSTEYGLRPSTCYSYLAAVSRMLTDDNRVLDDV